MEHLGAYKPRSVISLETVDERGWCLKRYATLATDRAFDEKVARAATDAALDRLPSAGSIGDGTGNHGVGFQIIHFAEIAVVSPVFYWQWGSVLANTEQMRAAWDQPMTFVTGVTEVVGCVWEMEIVSFEVEAWKSTMLKGSGAPDENLSDYMNHLCGWARL